MSRPHRLLGRVQRSPPLLLRRGVAAWGDPVPKLMILMPAAARLLERSENSPGSNFASSTYEAMRRPICR